MKNFLFKLLSFLNRFAHWCDIIIYYFLCNFLYKTQFSTSKLGWLVFVPLILQVYYCVKYEWKIFRSSQTIKSKINNGRVMGFGGKQGAGKSSLANYMASFRCFKKVYSNTPLKIRGQYAYLLEKDIYTLDSKIDDYSLLIMDEATLFWHNILSQTSKKGLSNELYAQEVMTQCVRHFWDGNIFYMSTDLNRLPPVIRENIGIVNFALAQGNKTISYLTGNIVCTIAKRLGFKMVNGIRYWDFQEFEKIPDKSYTFDLSNQEKDEDLTRFANLVRVYAWDNPNRFEYNDRFLHGVYAELPQHQDKVWTSLEFDIDLLKSIGYGELIDFFVNKKKAKTGSAVLNSEFLPEADSKE